MENKFRDVAVVQMIRTRLTVRGEGIKGDPCRRIEQYWDMQGNLVVEIDPYLESKEAQRAEPQSSISG